MRNVSRRAPGRLMGGGRQHVFSFGRLPAYGVLLAALSLPPARCLGDSPGPINVLVTVDVETRAGGERNVSQDIWGQVAGESEKHGIEKMMDLLDGHKMKGVFFVSAFEDSLHPEGTMKQVCAAIAARGHDIQLHTHPDCLTPPVRYMQSVDLPAQTALLQKGSDLIESWTGKRPIAHRAGAYMANLDTLKACQAVGLSIDISYNAVFGQTQLAQAHLTQSRPFVQGAVLCVPVTPYVQAAALGRQSVKFLDMEYCDPQEIAGVIEDLHSRGVTTAVIMMHSFSFVRDGLYRQVEADMDQVLTRLQGNPNVRIVTATELNELWRSAPARLECPDCLVTTGWWMTYCKCWHHLDRGPKYIVASASPPLIAGTLGGLFAFWLRRAKKRRLGKRLETDPTIGTTP